MGVGVRGALQRETLGRPVLPPVEVPERLPVEGTWAMELEGEPVVPALLVGAQQEAEIVDLETRRAALVAGLEAGDPAPHLAEEHLLRTPRKRRARRVEAKPCVGPLVVVHRVELRARDRVRAARHPTEIERPGDLVS